jgi:hypothetical protein
MNDPNRNLIQMNHKIPTLSFSPNFKFTTYQCSLIYFNTSLTDFKFRETHCKSLISGRTINEWFIRCINHRTKFIKIPQNQLLTQAHIWFVLSLFLMIQFNVIDLSYFMPQNFFWIIYQCHGSFLFFAIRK